MAITFLTNVSENEFKAFIKESIREILHEELQVIPNRPGVSEILDAEQAATYLHIKLSTLYEKTSGKLIPHFKKGNRLYFKRSGLEKWIKEGEIKTEAQTEGEALTYILNHHRNRKAA